MVDVLMIRVLFVILLTAVCCAAQPAAGADGKALFEENCALCHRAGAENRTPLPESLKRLPNEAIVAALET